MTYGLVYGGDFRTHVLENERKLFLWFEDSIWPWWNEILWILNTPNYVRDVDMMLVLISICDGSVNLYWHTLVFKEIEKFVKVTLEVSPKTALLSCDGTGGLSDYYASIWLYNDVLEDSQSPLGKGRINTGG